MPSLFIPVPNSNNSLLIKNARIPYKKNHLKPQHSYSILYPQLSSKEPMKIEKAAQLVLEYIQLPDDQYRLGKTKVLPKTAFFK